MPVMGFAGALHFCPLSFEIDKLPDWFERFVDRNPGTQKIEDVARSLATGGFDPEQTSAFVREVCNWGGYAGVGGRIIKHHSAELPGVMAGALDDVQAGKIGNALERLCGLKGFGVSFGSKHLKFLAPNAAVVLDSIISQNLGYPLTIAGYERFLTDCETILRVARDSALRYPGWGVDGWRVSDIEMAIFSKLEG